MNRWVKTPPCALHASKWSASPMAMDPKARAPGMTSSTAWTSASETSNMKTEWCTCTVRNIQGDQAIDLWHAVTHWRREGQGDWAAACYDSSTGYDHPGSVPSGCQGSWQHGKNGHDQQWSLLPLLLLPGQHLGQPAAAHRGKSHAAPPPSLCQVQLHWARLDSEWTDCKIARGPLWDEGSTVGWFVPVWPWGRLHCDQVWNNAKQLHQPTPCMWGCAWKGSQTAAWHHGPIPSSNWGHCTWSQASDCRQLAKESVGVAEGWRSPP